MVVLPSADRWSVPHFIRLCLSAQSASHFGPISANLVPPRELGVCVGMRVEGGELVRFKDVPVYNEGTLMEACVSTDAQPRMTDLFPIFMILFDKNK